jgi:hypothetical protein
LYIAARATASRLPTSVNLVDRQVEVCTAAAGAPLGTDYPPCQVFALADNVPVVLDGRTVGEIPVRAILS